MLETGSSNSEQLVSQPLARTLVSNFLPVFELTESLTKKGRDLACFDKVQKQKCLQIKGLAGIWRSLGAERVEVTGFEPVSKHDIQKLSTCLFPYCLSGNGRNGTNQSFP